MSFIEPMFAQGKELDELAMRKDGWNGWVAEPKHDGMRALIDKDEEGVVRVYSRSGKVYTQHVPHLVQEFGELLPNGTTIDGELAHIPERISVTEDRIVVPVCNFNKTMRVMGSLAGRAKELQTEWPIDFIAFDILKLDGDDITVEAWDYRRARLHTLLAWTLYLNPFFTNADGPYEDLFKELTSHKIEGIILKNRNGLYKPGKRPAQTWYKVKAIKTFDVVVTGFTDGEGKYKNQIGAIKFGAYDSDGTLVKDWGQCSGMTDEVRAWWTHVRNNGYVGDSGWPLYIIEVRSNELVGSGEFRKPRHPQYKGIREDKALRQCTMDQFQ